jgi:hypothetical protein
MSGDEADAPVDYGSTSDEGDSQSTLPPVHSFQAKKPSTVRFAANLETVHEIDASSSPKAGATDTDLRDINSLSMLLGAQRLENAGTTYVNPWLLAPKRLVAPGTLEMVERECAPNWVLPKLSFYDLHAFRIHDAATSDSASFAFGADEDEVNDYLGEALEEADPFLAMLGSRQALYLTIAHPTVVEPLPAATLATPTEASAVDAASGTSPAVPSADTSTVALPETRSATEDASDIDM